MGEPPDLLQRTPGTPLDRALTPGEAAGLVSLDARLASAGVDPATARATALLSGEDVLTRVGLEGLLAIR